jgi:hypothetical protein
MIPRLVFGLFWLAIASSALAQPQGGRVPSRLPVEFNQLLAATASTSGATSYATSSFTARRNSLVLLVVVNSKASAPDTPTVSGNGLTWVQIDTYTYGSIASPVQRLTVFRAMGEPTAGAATADFAGATQTGCCLYVVQFHNVDTSGTNGSGAIVQTAKNRADSSTSGSVTLSALDSGARNAVFVGWGGALNSSSVMSVEGGGATWVEAADTGYNTPATWIGAQYLLATTDNTPTATFTSQNWAGIAVEIKAAP